VEDLVSQRGGKKKKEGGARSQQQTKERGERQSHVIVASQRSTWAQLSGHLGRQTRIALREGEGLIGARRGEFGVTEVGPSVSSTKKWAEE